jgi:hypothetical protein
VRSSGTRDKLLLGMAGASCVLLLAACSKSASISSGASATGSGAPTAACSLLTQAEVAQATNATIAFSRQASLGSGSNCTYGSLSGFAVILSVVNSPAAGLSSSIPGVGNVVDKYHLTPVSGIGDQAYAGADAIIAQKGNTAFVIVYGAIGGGNHEQALKTMATDVASRL